MDRIDTRQVVSPERELPDREEPGQQYAPFHKTQIAGLPETAPKPVEKQRHEQQGWYLEDAKQSPSSDDIDRKQSQHDASDETPFPLPRLDRRRGIVLDTAAGRGQLFRRRLGLTRTDGI